jgi:MFS family permease
MYSFLPGMYTIVAHELLYRRYSQTTISICVQPLFGQLADIFGRRWLAVSIVTIFTIGSAICGAANGGEALIAGRAIQGVGSGGINMITDVIVSDLVPLRERGKLIAIILAVYSVGTPLGPFTGGILVEKTSWRFVFLISLPFGVLAVILFLLFLKVRSKRIPIRDGLARIDYIGNGIIVLSSISILLALSYADSPYPWSS